MLAIAKRARSEDLCDHRKSQEAHPSFDEEGGQAH